MLDLGASINVMPLAMYESLRIGPIKTSCVEIQLADKSCVYPEGIVEDVLVKVHDLIFPSDFYVLNMGSSKSKKQLMLLGRLFLKTARTLIDCDTGKLTCQFARETVTFEIYKAEQFPADTEMIDLVEVVNKAVKDCAPHLLTKDVYEQMIQGNENFPTSKNKELDQAVLAMAVEVEQEPHDLTEVVAEARNSPRRMPTSIEQPPKLELKRLSKHLKYIYLGEENTLPVIISADLSIKEEEETRRIMRQMRPLFAIHKGSLTR